MYLDIAHASGYIECDSIEEKNRNKYLVLEDIYEDKEVLEKYEEVWEDIKKKLKLLMVVKILNMGKNLKNLNLILMITYH